MRHLPVKPDHAEFTSLTSFFLLLSVMPMLAAAGGTGSSGAGLITGSLVLGTVATGALTARLLPPERRGEWLGLLGVVSRVPAVVALPAGVWLA